MVLCIADRLNENRFLAVCCSSCWVLSAICRLGYLTMVAANTCHIVRFFPFHSICSCSRYRSINKSGIRRKLRVARSRSRSGWTQPWSRVRVGSRIQCVDSVILWVLGKQFIPLLPVCLTFTIIVQSLPVSAAQKEDRYKTMAMMGMMEDFMV